MNDELGRIPDNAKFQANIFLGNVVLANGRRERMKDIKATCAMAAKLDGASTTYRRQVGSDLSDDRSKELVWQILDPETLSQFSERGLDGEMITYTELTSELKAGLNFLQQGYVALAPDVIMGCVSALDSRPAGPGDHAASAQTSNNENEPRTNSEVDTGELSAVQKGAEKGNGDRNRCNRCGGEGHYGWCRPTVPNATDTRQCRGCKGHGHAEAVYPTAHPHLKGAGGEGRGGTAKGDNKGNGKGSGWKEGSKGFGDKGGKGYGGQGKGNKGMSSIDTMEFRDPDQEWNEVVNTRNPCDPVVACRLPSRNQTTLTTTTTTTTTTLSGR